MTKPDDPVDEMIRDMLYEQKHSSPTLPKPKKTVQQLIDDLLAFETVDRVVIETSRPSVDHHRWHVITGELSEEHWWTDTSIRKALKAAIRYHKDAA